MAQRKVAGTKKPSSTNGQKYADENILVSAGDYKLAVNVRFWQVRDESTMPVSITINGILAVNGIKVINGLNGLFIGMPSYKKKDGTWEEYVYPVSKEARISLYEQILALADKHWEEL